MDKVTKEMQEHIAEQEELFERERLAGAAYTASHSVSAYLMGKYIRADDMEYVRSDIKKFINSYIENCYGMARDKG